MTKALFFLIPLASAIAMGFWLKHARQADGHRWITHWLTTLAPLGLLAGLHTIGLINNTVAQILMVPTVLGVAAFAGGALYLAGPTLLATLQACFGSALALFTPSLETRMRRANTDSKARKHNDDDGYHDHHSDAQAGVYYAENWHLYGVYDDKN